MFPAKIYYAFRFKEPEGNILDDLSQPTKPVKQKRDKEQRNNSESWQVVGDGKFSSPDGGDSINNLAETKNSAQLIVSDPLKFP